MRTESGSLVGLRDAHNAFLDPGVVANYEGWYETRGRRADRREKALLAKLLALFPDCRTIKEVGHVNPEADSRQRRKPRHGAGHDH